MVENEKSTLDEVLTKDLMTQKLYEFDFKRMLEYGHLPEPTLS